MKCRLACLLIYCDLQPLSHPIRASKTVLSQHNLFPSLVTAVNRCLNSLTIATLQVRIRKGSFGNNTPWAWQLSCANCTEEAGNCADTCGGDFLDSRHIFKYLSIFSSTPHKGLHTHNLRLLLVMTQVPCEHRRLDCELKDGEILTAGIHCTKSGEVPRVYIEIWPSLDRASTRWISALLCETISSHLLSLVSTAW